MVLVDSRSSLILWFLLSTLSCSALSITKSILTTRPTGRTLAHASGYDGRSGGSAVDSPAARSGPTLAHRLVDLIEAPRLQSIPPPNPPIPPSAVSPRFVGMIKSGGIGGIG